MRKDLPTKAESQAESSTCRTRLGTFGGDRVLGIAGEKEDAKAWLRHLELPGDSRRNAQNYDSAARPSGAIESSTGNSRALVQREQLDASVENGALPRGQISGEASRVGFTVSGRDDGIGEPSADRVGGGPASLRDHLQSSLPGRKWSSYRQYAVI